MFFIFGWGRQTKKEFGPTLVLKCSHCNNTGWWHLIEIRRWFTLFFVPVIPYSSKNLLLCPVCSYGLELDNDQMIKAMELNNVTTLFLQNEIEKSEYLAQVKISNIFGPQSLEIPGPSKELYKETVQDLLDDLALNETGPVESKALMDLSERYAKTETKELIKIITVCKHQYTQEAVQVVKAELRGRKMSRTTLARLLKEAQEEAGGAFPS